MMGGADGYVYSSMFIKWAPENIYLVQLLWLGKMVMESAPRNIP